MHAFLRVSIVVLIALGALLYNAADIVDPWYPWATYGITADSSGTIATVDDYASARGVRAGDVIILSKSPLADRPELGIVAAVHSGRTVDVPMRSGKTVRLTAHTRSRSLAENVTDILAVLSLVLYTLIAAALVLLRPMPATWAFFLFSAGLLYNGDQSMQYFPAWLVMLIAVVMYAILQAVGPVAFFSFALRFPNVAPMGRSKSAERILWFAAAPMLVGLNLASMALPIAGVAFPAALTASIQFAIAALYVPGIVQLIVRYVRSARDERARLQWAVAAFAVAFVPYLFFTAVQNANANIISLSVSNVVQAWLVIAPVALAYTVLKHRVYDIRFVVSRALIFGIMTTATVGILALADWAFGKWLEQSRFHLVAEVTIALLLGFSLTTLHKRIEHLLNRVIFAAQTAALSAIRRFSHEIDLIAEPHQLVAQTLQTLRQRVEAQFVAIYTEEGNAFVQSEPVAEAVTPLLSANDLAVLRLRRWTEPFECDVPGHPFRGALLLPMTVRAQLVGFIVCGPKTDHTHYIPEEVDTLQALAHRAGAGYAWLTIRPVTALTSYPQP
ncbi:MAG TPA: GAF domain-containing protein [Candidatus Baltobacteraceae bacterium]|nr:GAF domain-containing protein [Candidatus Baltobacteraceae bacterium]